MQLRIHHTTNYRYEKPVPYGLQRVRLIPKENASQKILTWNTVIDGGQVEADYTDYHNNHILLVRIHDGASEITIRCEGEVETIDNHGVIGRHGGHVPLWYFLKPTKRTEPTRDMLAFTRAVEVDKGNALGTLHALSKRIRETVVYETGHTDADTTADMALAGGYGVCQDHAHVFVTAARILGFPARYVSGYLMLLDRVDQEASHAWAEAHVDGIGWVGFDISNGISPDPRYVRIATGADYAEAAPISGVSYGGGEQTMRVNLAVEQQ